MGTFANHTMGALKGQQIFPVSGMGLYGMVLSNKRASRDAARLVGGVSAVASRFISGVVFAAEMVWRR